MFFFCFFHYSFNVQHNQHTLHINAHSLCEGGHIVIVDDLQNDLAAQLIDTAEKAADVDPRVLDAYIHQCTAEAQEGM